VVGPKPIEVRIEQSATAGYLGLSPEQRRRFKLAAISISRDRELGRPYMGDLHRRFLAIPGDDLDPPFDLMYVIASGIHGDEARIVFILSKLPPY
jgi:hypothetical protein